MTSLTDYIEINHHLMTVKEMVEETGMSNAGIRAVLNKKGWTAISVSDRTRDYIKAHPGAILEDIADRFGCTLQNIYKLARELGVDLVTRKQAENRQQPVKPKYSLMHRAFNDSDREGVKEDLAILLRETEKPKRFKDTYNQSGSPYGIADEVWKKLK